MRTRIALLALCASALLGCQSAENPVAPSGTVLTISAVPSLISLSGEGAAITVTGVRPDGNPLYPDTQITLTTSLGVLRPGSTSCGSTAVVNIVETDSRGQAFATLCGDGRVGEATVTASLTSSGGGGGGTGGEGGTGGAGTSTVSVTVQIGETDSSQPTLIISANPTIVPTLGTSTITLIGRNNDGTPVASGQRIRLTADLGMLSCDATYVCPGDSPGSNCDAVCTDGNGEAEAIYTAGARSGAGTVTAILGTSDSVSASITINAALANIALNTSTNTVERLETGDTVTLTATLTDALGTPLNAVQVRFEADVGSLDPVNISTNPQGVAETELTVTENQLSGISGDEGDNSFEVRAQATSEGVTLTATQTIRVLGRPAS